MCNFTLQKQANKAVLSFLVSSPSYISWYYTWKLGSWFLKLIGSGRRKCLQLRIDFCFSSLEEEKKKKKKRPHRASVGVRCLGSCWLLLHNEHLFHGSAVVGISLKRLTDWLTDVGMRSPTVIFLGPNFFSSPFSVSLPTYLPPVWSVPPFIYLLYIPRGPVDARVM